jgi:hypothetical protein
VTSADPDLRRTVTAAALADRLRELGLAGSSWSNGPNDTYAPHEHPYDKVLVVTAGSIRFGLTGGLGPSAARADVELDRGDRLDLPAKTVHDAIVGPSGVTCFEAHVPAGSLDRSPVRKPAGTW